MKLKISKNQWEKIGKTAGWIKKAQNNPTKFKIESFKYEVKPIAHEDMYDLDFWIDVFISGESEIFKHAIMYGLVTVYGLDGFRSIDEMIKYIKEEKPLTNYDDELWAQILKQYPNQLLDFFNKANKEAELAKKRAKDEYGDIEIEE